VTVQVLARVIALELEAHVELPVLVEVGAALLRRNEILSIR
jgi:hypothetical protein